MVNKIEKQGNLFFRYRGQFPIILFVLAIPFLYFTNPLTLEVQNIYTMIAVFCSFFGFLIRAYTIGTTPEGTSGRNTKEQLATELNTTGIYSLVRHPLYLGNYFIWIGIVIYCYNLYFVALVSLLFVFYYHRIIYVEENFLKNKFGKKYLDWSENVSACCPAFRKYKASTLKFSIISVFRREYSGLLATFIAFSYVSLVRGYFHFKILVLSDALMICLLVGLLFSIVFRTLKNHTKLLDEKGRF